jgi:hypothetical protein
MLDTSTGAQVTLASDDALRRAAAERGVVLDLQSSYLVHLRREFSWFDGLTAIVAALPVLLVLFSLVKSTRAHRLARQTGGSLSPTTLLQP